MIVQINNADFSEKNIGKISTGIDPFTIAAIAASGNTTMSNNQKIALNTFFKQIGATQGSTSQIFGKMKFIYLPMIAADVAKALVNYKTNNVDFAPSSDDYQIRNHGIVKTSSHSGFTKVIDKISPDNFSMTVLRNEVYTVEDPISNEVATCTFGLRGVSDTSIWIGSFYINKSTAGTSVNMAMTGLASSPFATSPLSADAIAAQTINSDGNKVYRLINNTLSSKDKSLADFSGETSQRLYVFLSAVYKPVGAMIIGESLSNDEMYVINNALNELKNYFLNE